jgi:hypothetical protein
MSGRLRTCIAHRRARAGSQHGHRRTAGVWPSASDHRCLRQTADARRTPAARKCAHWLYPLKQRGAPLQHAEFRLMLTATLAASRLAGRRRELSKRSAEKLRVAGTTLQLCSCVSSAAARACCLSSAAARIVARYHCRIIRCRRNSSAMRSKKARAEVADPRRADRFLLSTSSHALRCAH